MPITQRVLKTTRPETMIAPPAKLAQAYDDGDAVIDLIHRGAPYKTLSAVHKHPGETLTGGWFRNFWALGGKVVFPGAEAVFHNPRFIAAAKKSFRAEVIRPLTMMTNLNLPAASLPPHLDLPFFRGMTNREVPSWMLAPMGYSGLFQDWAIPVASAITWFYEGEGGEFEYWPEGFDRPSRTERPPYSNSCVVADNEYMYHRVGATGTPAEYWAEDSVPYGALLHLTDDRRFWVLRDGDRELARLPYAKVRLSVLWKAYCFETQAMADSYDEHSYDLTPERVVDLFCADLKRRGIAVTEPSDFATDLSWKELLTSTYRPPAG